MAFINYRGFTNSGKYMIGICDSFETSFEGARRLNDPDLCPLSLGNCGIKKVDWESYELNECIEQI